MYMCLCVDVGVNAEGALIQGLLETCIGAVERNKATKPTTQTTTNKQTPNKQTPNKPDSHGRVPDSTQ